MNTVTFAQHAGPPTPQPPTASSGEQGWPLRGRRAVVDLVVVAPHPDDETLIASGLILAATRAGKRVAVIVMTNGDFDCRVDGLQRQRESVQALSELGVAEDAVYFLGYPDGYLARLGRAPLQPLPRRVGGVCVHGAQTYGANGHGGSDYHHARLGAHATYTAANAVGDLRRLLGELQPTRLVVTHPNDSHPDHAATYALLRRALRDTPQRPQVLRAFVHTEDCWPTGADAEGRCLPGEVAPSESIPPLGGVLVGYHPDVRVPVPSDCLTSSFETNPKLRAIGAHHSQTHDDAASYLFAFARAEEVFYSQVTEHPWKHLEVVGRAVVPRRNSADSKDDQPPVIRTATAAAELALEIDRASNQAVLWRNTTHGETRLQAWPLPHDLLLRRTTFELRLERLLADDTAELGLYAANNLLGVAIVVKSGLRKPDGRIAAVPRRGPGMVGSAACTHTQGACAAGPASSGARGNTTTKRLPPPSRGQ